jgi:hypothetical protein
MGDPRRRPRRLLDVREIGAQVQAEYEALGIPRTQHGAYHGIDRARIIGVARGSAEHGYRAGVADQLARQFGYAPAEVRMAANLIPTPIRDAIESRDMKAIRIAYEALKEAGYR